MDDDFNTPVALAALHDLARAINREAAAGAPAEAVAQAQGRLIELSGVLGLRLESSDQAGAMDVAPFIDLMLEIRQELRAKQEWSLADTIRQRLEVLGVRIEDSSSGSTWRMD
jgi:cysteinyl-tRNA synthetase